MANRENVVSNAKAGDSPDLNFGLEELLNLMVEDLPPYLDESKELTAVTLAKRLGVSPQTARKKLIKMEKAGTLERVERRTLTGNKVMAWRGKC